MLSGNIGKEQWPEMGKNRFALFEIYFVKFYFV